MLILKRHFEYWYTLLALHKLGAVAIPATSLLTEKDIIYRVDKVSIKAIVAAEDASVIKNVTSACAGRDMKLFTVRRDAPGFARIDLEANAESAEFERVTTGLRDPMLIYLRQAPQVSRKRSCTIFPIRSRT